MYAKQEVPFQLFEVDLSNASDEQLVKTSKELGINLSLEEMKKARDYFFKERGRNPYDIELQAIGQAWSEHCSYKSSKPILKKFIFDIEAPQNIWIIKDDAGVVEFDNEYAYVVAFESHNHPSAVEPYGGAATGIGGILRDVLCMGAQPIALVDPLFFGPLDYSYSKLPKGTKHPRFLFSGVVAGISDYGNRVGIPTVTGMVYFDDSYIGNCIVNVGCVGIAKKEHIIKSRVKEPGDILILLGGKTGRDGIHGVTFASAELDEKSETSSRGAVQVGQPIVKEALMHVCIELTKRGLLNGMKDLGGGGLSCVVGEITYAAGFGGHVNLEAVPLKEEGMAPWEIWVSESQERMLVAVAKKNVDEVLHISKFWDVDASVIGEVIEEPRLVIDYKGYKIFDMDIKFLVDAPIYHRPYEISRKVIEDPEFEEPLNFNQIFLNLLGTQNIASKEEVIRRYDYEVRASTVVKPMHGAIGKYTHGDASVIKPLFNSSRGLALTSDINPSYMKIDAFWGAASAVDEICRNLVAVGATPHSLADCLNFGNPEKADRLGVFFETARGFGHVAKAFGIPFVSGNVSFYNETSQGSVAPTPTLIGVGLIDDINKAITSDFKKEGNSIYLIGETKKELGGSEYYKMLGLYSTSVPRVDVEILKKSVNAMLQAFKDNLIVSCHDLSNGGLAVSLAEMSFGGIGAEVDTRDINNLRADIKLFSESNTRWIVEITDEDSNKFEELMKKSDIKISRIGRVGSDRIIIKDGMREIINLPINQLKESWSNGMAKYV